MQRTIFTDEHEMFRDAFRQFVDKEIVPGFLQWEADGIVPRELFAAAGASGFLGMDVPEELGGGGVEDFRYNLIIGEELQRSGTGGAGLGITLHNDICLPYFTSLCTDEQKQRWLPGICSGELITAIAMTEPGIGSDLASMGTTAIRDGDRYVVNGSKTFITNGARADVGLRHLEGEEAGCTGRFPHVAADDARLLPLLGPRHHLAVEEGAVGTAEHLVVIVEDGPRCGGRSHGVSLPRSSRT